MHLSLQKGMWRLETSDAVNGRGFDRCGDFCGNGALYAFRNTGCANTDTDRRNRRQHLRVNQYPGK